MDVIKNLFNDKDTISTIEMHTEGEPTRIVYSGFPSLQGTLLQQRQEAAKEPVDRIRRRLMLEPRGHRDMYGAILRPDTEHTLSGRAHMGVLFTTNDGYSTMCGHATIALSRFLIDTHDLEIFPQRHQIKHNADSQTANLLLHAPCGIIDVTVPTTANGTRSDPSRPVSHVSVPSFATGIDVRIPIPGSFQWPELQGRDSVVADFSYGGAFYCLVSAANLGFPSGLAVPVNIAAMDLASKNLKAAVNNTSALRHLFRHPDHEDLGFLYSVIVVDSSPNLNAQRLRLPGTHRVEIGLCFFADQQIDRSPTGSGVAARVALAFAKDPLTMQHEAITYKSLLSNSLDGEVGFAGRFHEKVGEKDGLPVVRVKVDGFASYTGASTFVVEDTDALKGDGFLLDRLRP